MFICLAGNIKIGDNYFSEIQQNPSNINLFDTFYFLLKRVS